MRLLIADDDRPTRIILRKNIQRWGYDVEEASDGDAALEILERENPPRIAVLDWMMPAMDGVEVCRRLSEKPNGSPIYTILLTSKHSKEDVVLALDSGAHDFLTKPVDTNELRSRIAVGKRVMESEERQKEYAREMEHLARRLSSQLDFQKTLMDAIPIPIFVKDYKTRYISCNKTFLETTGLTESQVIGRTTGELFPQDPDLKLHHDKDMALLADREMQRYETILTFPDGIPHHLIIHKDIFKDSDGHPGGMVGALLDITKRKQMEEELKHLATCDPLTNILNRRCFFEKGREAFLECRGKSPLSLFLMDIDHFKQINDNFGHGYGDEALIAFVQAVKSVLGDEDIFGRLGGEEFAVILPHQNLQEGQEKAEAVRASVEALSLKAPNGPIHFSVSLGLVQHMEGLADSLEMLLNFGDEALYKAKRNGRNRVALFEGARL